MGIEPLFCLAPGLKPGQAQTIDNKNQGSRYMFVIIGYIIVFPALSAASFGRRSRGCTYPASGIHHHRGAAVGAVITAHGGAPMKAIFAAVPGAFKASRYNKALYMELFALLYELLSKVRKEGLMSIEADVDDPQNSPIFSKYPIVVDDHVVINFSVTICA